jgi:hypothetical protein
MLTSARRHHPSRRHRQASQRQTRGPTPAPAPPVPPATPKAPGTIDVEAEAPPAAPPRLIIRGFVGMGGLVIKSL